MSIAKFNFDVFTNTLTISKTFEKNASFPGSAEQKMISEFLTVYGDALVIKRYAAHKVRKGLTFAKMANYIKQTRDAATMLKRFESVKLLSRSQKNPYKYVLEWFTDNYPNYSEQPDFDKDGFVIVKALDENHTQNDAENAENTISKLAEEPTENTAKTQLPEQEDTADQNEQNTVAA